MRRLRERHRLEAALGVTAHLGRADLRVEEVGELQRDDAVGIVGGPLLDDPVVPGADAREREVGITGELLQALPRETGQERREAERGIDTVEVHVVDAGADVPRAATHLVEARGLEAVLRHRAPDHGVEPDVRQLLALEHPRLAAVVALHDAWRAVLQLARQPSFERVRRFHHVVVDGDHGELAGSGLRLGEEAHLALRRGGEPGLVRQVLDRDRHG